MSSPLSSRIVEVFPYPSGPYQTQLSFIESMFGCFSRSRHAIFESPTGTGKSLSVLLSSLLWLENRRNAAETANPLSESDSDSDEWSDDKRSRLPSWIQEESALLESARNESPSRNRKRKRVDDGSVSSVSAVTIHDENRDGTDYTSLRARKRRRLTANAKRRMVSELLQEEERRATQASSSLPPSLDDEDDDSEFLLSDLATSGSAPDDPNGLAAILHDLYANDRDFQPRGRTAPFRRPKILYATRTNSQISQFMTEAQKVLPFFPSLSVVAVVSRKFVCCNDTLKRSSRGNASLLGEKCMESKSECRFFSGKNFELYVRPILSLARDIENLVEWGSGLGVCPYYATRRALREADMLVLPYSTLLSEGARKSVGIDSLEDCIVIVDEAHNLIDSILGTHSVVVRLSELKRGLRHLSQYLARYKKRLKRRNLTSLSQTIRVLLIIYKFVFSHANQNQEQGQNRPREAVYDMNDFLLQTELINVNFYDITTFIDQSQLARKLNGFVGKYLAASTRVGLGIDAEIEEEHVASDERNVIYLLKELLSALTNIQSDCKILIKSIPNESGELELSIRLLLLNPNVYFRSVVSESNAVVLTGGTMDPIGSVTRLLFPENQVETFRFPHIVPPNHLLTLTLSHCGNVPFRFVFQNRSNPSLLSSLGSVLVRLSTVVPDGMIVFFSSYSYEEEVFEFFRTNGIIRQLQKRFFREPRDSREMGRVLDDYRRTIDRGVDGGSILHCVVGGKMSEGLNFKDGYGRCVVVVGLPFPNPNDLELRERMNFHSRVFSSPTIPPRAVIDEYLLDICMTRVNQSIGRSIRHGSDYGAIVLLDERYATPRIGSKLPHWIRTRGVVADENGSGFQMISDFFRTKSQSQERISRERLRGRGGRRIKKAKKRLVESEE